MKISEIRKPVNEDIADNIKSGLYKVSGGGLFGQTGQQAALKNNYIKKFSNQLALNMKSARSSGVGPFDLDDYLKSYAGQYGWNLTPKEIENLSTLASRAGPNPNANSLNKIANYMYILADKYRDSRKTGGAPEIPAGNTGKRSGPTGPTTPNPTGPTTPNPTSPTTPTPTSPTAPNTTQPAALNSPVAPLNKQINAKPQNPTSTPNEASVTAEKIMDALSQLYKTPKAASDLDKILRDVAYLLSKKDPARYAHVMKDLTSGLGGTGAAGTKGTPYPGDQPTQQRTRPTSTQPSGTQSTTNTSDAEQAMPGYTKASDDLASKMKSNLPRDPTITKAYRPGSRPQGVTDVEPKEPKLKEYKKFKRK